ncbi:hypothetical protein PoB_007117700 [Plakobranchus ocellatus]|uniref:Secreted protein n=1 Tax=Plakobranchus ocellatus TaxID=259542 RepID=A0AAV4DK66_9GAST|nr:hypothetical protein PoB_007117700 [Plakobranchus ocellatus]
MRLAPSAYLVRGKYALKLMFAAVLIHLRHSATDFFQGLSSSSCGISSSHFTEIEKHGEQIRLHSHKDETTHRSGRPTASLTAAACVLPCMQNLVSVASVYVLQKSRALKT